MLVEVSKIVKDKLHISKPTLRLGSVTYPSFGSLHSGFGKKELHGPHIKKKESLDHREFKSLLATSGDRGSHGLGVHNGSKKAKKNPHFPRLLAK